MRNQNESIEPLKPLERRLLEYLRAHARLTITRDELAANVWQLRMDPRSRTIDQTVSTLRRKLAFGERILTRHSRGYEYTGAG